MLKPINKEIARKGFMSLVLDYDIPADDYGPEFVSCRVLNDGYYFGAVTAESIAEAIDKFEAGEVEKE